MERVRKNNLLRHTVGAITFAGMAFILHSLSIPQTVEAAHTRQVAEDNNDHLLINSTKSDLIGLSGMIPYFFEGCEVLARGWIGRGSVYTEAGCVGCREDLLMASGVRLSDNRKTFAAWRDELNTDYLLRNTVNGLRSKGKLTDRGGFDRLANPKPVQNSELAERTFDLSLALSNSLGSIRTGDNTLIDFNKLRCS